MPDARDVWNSQLAAWGIDSAEIRDLLNRSVTDSMSSEGLKAELFRTNTFKQAFPEYEASIRAGTPMDPSTILNYRAEVKRTMINAGIPPGFYDTNQDFAQLIDNKLSVAEIGDRVSQGLARVYQAPQEVKDTFNSFFGAQGDSALATLYLDPTKGKDLLLKMATQAEIGGTGKRFGFDVGMDQASRLAELGINAGSAAQGFEQAKALRPLTEETISEENDITSQEAVGSVFGDDAANAKERLARRSQERTAAFQGGGGGAQTERGLGLGSAR